MIAQATLGLALDSTMLANRATVRPKAKALGLENPVCEDTLDTAVATPTDKRGFVVPKFWGLVRLHRPRMVCGGMGQTARLAARLYPCLQHPAHFLRVKMQEVASKSHTGATMSVSMGHHAPTSKAAPAITTTEALSHALLTAFYLRKGNLAAARRKAVQLLKSLQAVEVAA